MQIGDTVKLLRKYTSEVLEMELTDVLVTGNQPMVEVQWRDRSRYKLDLEKNQVLAIEASQRRRHAMKVWYSISEPDRIALTRLFWDMRKTRRK